eukprot:Seg21948.1 transcript_id=Seg21948.1/GoldUCD/mRNA.D3Y31 product="hypothetical protein" protein_id=Seg21948.1/GoldUCD/D3Y31
MLSSAQEPPMPEKKPSTVKTFQAEFTINASIDTCWKAWTDGKQLSKWLGTVKVGNKVGDDYNISTIIPYISGRHEIAEIKPKELLKLNYFIEGWKSELTIHFEAKEKKTSIRFTISVETKDAPESILPLHHADHYFYFIGGSWHHAIKRMRCFIEDGSVGVEIAPQKNNGHNIHLVVDIKATPEKIWPMLTDAKVMRTLAPEFFVEGTEVETKKRGQYSYGWYPKGTPEKDLEDGPNKILEIEKNKLLIHDWYGGTEVAKITWKLEPQDNDTTRVTFSHAPILGHTLENVWSYRSGWSELLYAMKWYAERTELEPTWWKVLHRVLK